VYEGRKLTLAAARMDIPAGRGDVYNLKVGVGMANKGSILYNGTKIPMGSITYKTVLGTIDPWGQGVSLDTRLLKLSPHDLRAGLAKESLAKDIIDTWENSTLTEMMTATTTVVLAGTATTTGSRYVGTGSGFYMNTAGVLRLANKFALQSVPPVTPDGKWLLYMHPNQLYDLVNDYSTGGWTDITKYGAQGLNKFSQYEAGEIYGFKVITCNRMTGTTNKTGDGTTQLISAIGIGASAISFVWAEGGEPTFAYEPDYETDFGRVQALAWMADGDIRLIVDEYVGQLYTLCSANSLS
jgi:N4-gp56 family major capsid protein